jgi:hypothetical protein
MAKNKGHFETAELLNDIYKSNIVITPSASLTIPTKEKTVDKKNLSSQDHS